MAQRGSKLIERIAFLFDARFQQIAIFLHENGRNVRAQTFTLALSGEIW